MESGIGICDILNSSIKETAMKLFVHRISLLLAILLFAACAPKSEPIVLLSAHSGETVAINDDVISSYLDLPVSDSLAFLTESSYQKTGVAHDGQEIVLSWEGGEAPYVVQVGHSPELSDAEEWTTSKTRQSVGILVPDTDYWWRVADAKGNVSECGSFRTGTGVRMISARKTLKADGVRNVRDLGGKSTEDGRTVRYGLLYRGGLLTFNGSVYGKNVIDDFGLDMLNRLQVRTELDLRNDQDVGGQKASPLNGCAYERYTFSGYTSIFPDAVWFDERTPGSLCSIFSLFAKEENYPVYFHCLIGQDRTGTLAYLLLGLAGVSYDDILRDYELTAFSPVGNMNRKSPFVFSGETSVRQDAAFEAMHERMLRYSENGILSDAVANYLISECGITQEQIDSIRSILLSD